MSLTRSKNDDDHEASIFALSLATWAVPAYVLKAILELEVLEIIKKAGPEAQLSTTEIAAQLPTTNQDAPMVLDRMLRLLANFSILTFSLRTQPNGGTERVYGLAHVCKFLTKNEDGGSFAPYALILHDKVLADVLCGNNLKESLLKGEVPFENTHGMNVFEYLGKDSRFNDAFNRAMNSHSTILLRKILDMYKGFEGLSSLVDVGGGTGYAANMIVTKYPIIKAINFDLPHVVENAPSYIGVEHVEGDMYVSIPKADAMFMKWIFHLGSDEKCLRLLKNCYAALPKHGKVIGCEFVAPDEPEASYAANLAFTFDNIMLAVPGGKERTKQEYEALGIQAGFQGFQLVCNVCGCWVMEFLKNN